MFLRDARGIMGERVPVFYSLLEMLQVFSVSRSRDRDLSSSVSLFYYSTPSERGFSASSSKGLRPRFVPFGSNMFIPICLSYLPNPRPSELIKYEYTAG